MINPYENVDFENCIRVSSFTHSHAPNQNNLNRLFNWGYKFLPVSNYYPSTPLDTSLYEIPSDVIIAPNAEHSNFTVEGKRTGYVHLNSLGSTFSSGSPKGQSPVGYNGGRWQDFMDDALALLKYSDGGGITINHPSWTRLYDVFLDDTIMSMLDYDSRVLGIEIFNGSSVRDYNAGLDIQTWDNILKTGRRCWGFSTPDWDVINNPINGKGRCVLLVDEFTEEKCLQAYRSGRFYAQEGKTNLAFADISVSGQRIEIETENADYIVAVIDGERTVYETNRQVISVPPDATYVRFEAKTEDDAIYSQPIMYKEPVPIVKHDDSYLLIY